MSIPLVQNNEKDAINTSIIAIKRNIERINMLLGLVDNDSPDLSGFATKQELQDAVTELQPVDEVTIGNMQSVSSNAVASYSAPKIRNKNQGAVFAVFSNWGIQVTEQEYDSTSALTWQPMLNVLYEQDGKNSSLGFFKNDLALIKNTTEQYFVMLNEVAEGKPIVIKHKEITAVTNEHGTFVLTDERPISIMVMNINDAMCIIGNSFSGANLIPWVKVCNYNFTPLANTSVVLNMYYI